MSSTRKVEELLAELKNNPAIQKYLSKYDEKSAEEFLSRWAFEKSLILSGGEIWRTLQNRREVHYKNEAEHYYWIIAQKKLFNVQCKFRAGQIALPITYTVEFGFWRENIRSCPFIDDVTEEEIDAMIAYLGSEPYFEYEHEPYDWQDYDEFRDGNDADQWDEYPDWFEFYDTWFKTDYLKLLPDKVGQLERRYYAALRDKDFEEAERRWTEEQNQRKEKINFFDYDFMLEFVKKFESYHFFDQLRYTLNARDRSRWMENLQEAMELMADETEPVVMKAGVFPDAIYQAAHDLKVSKLKRLLPIIHEEHMERKKMGISYEIENKPFWDDLYNKSEEAIQRGKKKLGEE